MKKRKLFSKKDKKGRLPLFVYILGFFFLFNWLTNASEGTQSYYNSPKDQYPFHHNPEDPYNFGMHPLPPTYYYEGEVDIEIACQKQKESYPSCSFKKIEPIPNYLLEVLRERSIIDQNNKPIEIDPNAVKRIYLDL